MSFIGTGYGEATLRWRALTTTRDSTVVVGFKNNTNLSASVCATSIYNLCIAAGNLAVVSGYSSTYAWRGVRVVVERGAGPEIDEATANITGTLVADPVPPNVAVLVRKTTALGGRRGRGRMFLPPIFSSETTVDSVGNLSGAAVTTYQNKVNTFLSAMGTNDTPVYLLHSSSEITPTLVLSMPVQAVVATQRRRLRR